MTLDDYLAAYGGKQTDTRLVDGIVFYRVWPRGGRWWIAGKGEQVIVVAELRGQVQVSQGGHVICSPDGHAWFGSVDGALHVAAQAARAL